MTQNPDPKRTPYQVLSDLVTASLLETRTAIPGRVKAVRKQDPCRVDIEVGVKQRYRNSDTLAAPIIVDVPVIWPTAAGGTAGIRLPIATGDTGLLIVSDRAIERWRKGTGGQVDPADSRTHNIADAVFVPGLTTDSGALSIGYSGTNLQAHNGSMKIVLHPSGQIEIEGATAELVATLYDAFLALSTATAAGIPLSCQADMLAAAVKLATLKV